MHKIPQTGLIIERPGLSDYMLGALTYEILLPDGDWTPYLPTGERQNTPFSFDTLSCATFSYLNTVESQFLYRIRNGKLSQEHLKFLNDNGYFDSNGNINFSDRFTAIMSGTTTLGNSLTKVADSGRNHGLIPQSKLDYGNAQTWWEWHNPAVITTEMKNLGIKFKEYFDIAYEWTFYDDDPSFSVTATLSCSAALKQCPLQIAIPVPATHALMMSKIDIEDEEYQVFDSYPPYDDDRTWNDKIHYAMKVIVTPKALPQKWQYFSPSEVVNLKTELVALLDKARGLAGIPFVITSGFRTPAQNLAVGGAPNSAHLTGEAADIRCLDSYSRFKIVNALLSVGFTRIETARSHVHCDISKTLPQKVFIISDDD